MRSCLFVLASFAVLAAATPQNAEARVICTIVADAADGEILSEDGDCVTQVTPASTFKLALALMGFDSGYLTDATAPRLPYKEGYVDWGGENWTQPTDPMRWMKYSVVWYSQQMTHALGVERLERYAASFGYGNADLSGDPGKDNGLDRAWIISSLKISPREQVAFLGKFVNRTLPVSPRAFEATETILEAVPVSDGWTVQGKTGAAFPRHPDGTFDYERGYGWYVGWAKRADRTLLFARLIQDERKEAGTPGLRARDAFLKELPSIADAAR
ncbi:MAG: class D beta-lactamase [Rhizobiaceae bacterium]|nr:class D beta-lactamase [Rhizobiaceae bacterium]